MERSAQVPSLFSLSSTSSKSLILPDSAFSYNSNWFLLPPHCFITSYLDLDSLLTSPQLPSCLSLVHFHIDPRVLFLNYKSYLLLPCFKSFTDPPLFGDQAHIGFCGINRILPCPPVSSPIAWHSCTPDFTLPKYKNTGFSNSMLWHTSMFLILLLFSFE